VVENDLRIAQLGIAFELWTAMQSNIQYLFAFPYVVGLECITNPNS
jgi:hypothetical protein